MRILLLPISVLFASAFAQALPPGVAELAARLARRSAFECDFVQERTLPVMRAPLRSSGVFRMEPGEKAAWIQRKPVEQTIMLRRDGMELGRPDGTTQKLSSSAPVAGAVPRRRQPDR